MNDKTAAIKKIPYGISDYEKIVAGNYYYVDKTPYLQTTEEAGDYLFFIRPRRFGKSLFLSLMETYYDISKEDQFDFFYKGTHVHHQPTAEKNKYLVLTFNFSAVDPHHKQLEASFLNNVQNVAGAFLHKYRDYLEEWDREKLRDKLESTPSAADILLNLTHLCRKSGQRLYVLIDEYDNFANTILSTSGSEDYKDLTHGKGFFRSFFNVLKQGTSGSGAPISRLFITGVSPITLDDVTSGFNIGKNISVDPGVNRMLGFTKDDVIEMIEYYRAAGKIKHETEYLLEIMAQWYNNYTFSKESHTSLFNSDMVLYFLDEYFKVSRIPDELMDRNVRMDYSKLRHLILIDRDGKKEGNGNFSRLREIVEDGEVASKLKKGFPLEEMESPENFTSLLFYFGLLSIKGEKEGLSLFKMPNQTVKSLYYDYIIRVSQETGLLKANIEKIVRLLHGMAYHGDWNAFFEYISLKMNESSSIRDFIREEKMIQGFLVAYLGISDYFIVHSEKELNKGYADIVLEPFIARYEGIKYSYLIEIKYISRSENKKQEVIEAKLRQLRAEAEAQLKTYAGDEAFKKSIGKTTLLKLVVVFHGSELKYIGPAD
jgi:hypothetical protein